VAEAFVTYSFGSGRDALVLMQFEAGSSEFSL
jgi:hypothetical protein